MIRVMAAEPAIGTRIKKRRQQLHLTQVQLAERLGVNPSTVLNWEKGKHFPVRYQGAVEQVLGITLDGDGEELYTDPLERQIWEESSLLEDERRDLIAQLRRKRREHVRRTENPPA